MESKVNEYQKLYEKFAEIDKQASKAEESIHGMEKEIKQLEAKQKKVDYNNPSVIIGYMETYVDESIAKEKRSIQNEVNKRMGEITEHSEKVRKNFDKAVKWLSKAKVDKYLHSADIDFQQPIRMRRAEKATQLKVFIVLNTILSFVFRFDFLRFLPKALRIIAGVVFWIIFLVPKLLEGASALYIARVEGLSRAEYEMLEDQILMEYFTGFVIAVIAVAVAIVAVNILIYVLTKYSARKYLADNQAVCYAVIDKNGLKQKMYDAGIARYMEGTVADWKKEIEAVKKDGLGGDQDNHSLINLVKSDLRTKYNLLGTEIADCYSKIEEIRKQGEQAKARLQSMIPALKAKEKEVGSLVSDSAHNDAVLSPYVSVRYSPYTIRGVKKLLYCKHDYKPVLFCYDDDTARDGEGFRESAAKVIEGFMNGFFQENYYDYINMRLVDFEGLHFPDSRTKGLMKVVRNPQGVQQIFEELKAVREKVDSLGNGRINDINPVRLANHENPIRYNVIYFIGYDFTAVDREISQLFISGENFGFLPIVFMKRSAGQEMLNDHGLSRAFSRVVEKMKEDRQVYRFENFAPELVS